MNNENLLKRFLKKKIKFTQSLLVTFLITGGVSFASIDFNNYNSTINEIKSEGTGITFNNYALSLTSTNLEGEVKVFYGYDSSKNPVYYYFTPNGEYKELENILAGTSAGIITETNGVYEISFDISKLPESSYNLTFQTLTEVEYNDLKTKGGVGFISYTKNADETITTNYYTYSFEPTFVNGIYNQTLKENSYIDSFMLGDENNYSFKIDTIVNGVVETKYYKVNENTSSGIQPTNTAITTNQNGANVENHFIGKNAALTGGAILNNNGSVGNITGDFIGNYILIPDGGTTHSKGGAISNESGTIEDITGDFIGNYISTTTGNPKSTGGAIYNANGSIGNITGNYIGNYVISKSTNSKFGSTSLGGAIYNDKSDIGNITGNFIGNYASNMVQTSSSATQGGAIFNSNGRIGDITGNFIRNFTNNSSTSIGGAIYNYNSDMGNITGDFIGNYASTISTNTKITEAKGGAIYQSNSSTTGINSTSNIGDITGNFIGNFTDAGIRNSQGGAIYQYKVGNEIGDIVGSFIGNYSVVSSMLSASSFQSNAQGGAIYNNGGKIGGITGDFIGNYVKSVSNLLSTDNETPTVYGGAIYQDGGGEIGDIVGNFIGNHAIATEIADAKGGAIYQNNIENEIGDITGDFIGNYATSALGEASGGAIYNLGKLTLLADIKNIEFTDNYIISSDGNKVSNAIYNDGTIDLLAASDKKIIFNDTITGTSIGVFNIGGTRTDDTTTYDGTVILNNSMSGYEGTTNFKGGTIQIGSDMQDADSNGFTDFFSGNFVVGEMGSSIKTSLDVLNNKVDRFDVTNWITNTELDMKLDINGETLETDSLVNINGHDINISELNVYNDIDNIGDFAQSIIKIGEDGTDYKNLTLTDKNVDVTDSIYNYTLTVVDDRLNTDGELYFQMNLVGLLPSTPIPPTDTDTTVPPETIPPLETLPPGATDYNDNILQTTVAVGGYASNMGNISRRVLNSVRKHEFKNSVWVDTFGADENIKYSTDFGDKRFDNKIYAVTAGVDFDYDLLKGLEEKGSIFFGHYNGMQEYNSIDIDQEGYYIGVGTELKKENSYVQLTAMYGLGEIEEVKEKYDVNSLYLGVKIGEEYRSTDKLSIEPSVQFGYSMINSEDYTNNKGVDIETETLGMFNISQELKIMYKGETIKPYAVFSYNVNGYTNGEITAKKGTTKATLPGMETESYFEGKIGASKKLLNDTLNVYGEIIGTFKDKDSYGAQVGIEYKF